MIVVLYHSRDGGPQIEGGHHTVEAALGWVAEDPIPDNDDDLYQLWDVVPGRSAQMVRELWPAETQKLAADRG